jgi:hypothetical protein
MMRAREDAAELACRIEAVQRRHRHVEDRDIRFELTAWARRRGSLNLPTTSHSGTGSCSSASVRSVIVDDSDSRFHE